MRIFRILLVLVPAAAAAQPETATVYLGLGEKAEAVEDWSGSIAVSGGDLTALEERHFSEADRLTGSNKWVASTREERIRGFPRVNYNEMSPAELPPTQYSPVGLFATVRGGGSARVAVKTRQGNFSFRLSELTDEAKSFLDGRATAALTPAVEKLSSEEYEDDEAALVRLSDHALAAAWVAYRDRGDRVLWRVRENGVWGDVEEVTGPGDIWRVSPASPGAGKAWVFWSLRDGTRWDLWGRLRGGGSWSAPQKISGGGSNTFHRAASADGKVFVVWQSFQGAAGKTQSDIYLRVYDNGAWGEPLRVSESDANDWEPQIASGPDGEAHIVWDSYDAGNYDVFYRAYANGKLGRRRTGHPQRALSSSRQCRRGQCRRAVACLGRVRRELGQGSGLSDYAAAVRAAAPGTFDPGRQARRRLVGRAESGPGAVLRLPPLSEFRESATRIRRDGRADRCCSGIGRGKEPTPSARS